MITLTGREFRWGYVPATDTNNLYVTQVNTGSRYLTFQIDRQNVVSVWERAKKTIEGSLPRGISFTCNAEGDEGMARTL